MAILNNIVLVAFCVVALNMSAQNPDERDGWIERYLSVSYPLRNIKVTSGYGTRKDPFSGKLSKHSGLDLIADYEKVMSMFDGVVVETGKNGRAGVFATVRYGEYKVSYCHLSKLYVIKGDRLLAGDAIGVSGNTGRSTGPHLHITVKRGTETVNPYNLLLYIRDVRREAYLALGGASDIPLEPEEFFKKYAPLAMEQQRKYGIPSSVTLAQMACESKWGRSALARKGNNYFGIKATCSWINEGKPYSRHNDDKPNEAFCNYNSPQESIEHHSRLLMTDRYKRCRQYPPTDYHNWLVCIKNAGYATAKNYVHDCERIIQQYQLYKYDILAKC